MEIKTADQLMRLVVGVRLHYRGTLKGDEFNYMVRSRKAPMDARESIIYRDKLNLIKRSGVCPLNWAYHEARNMRGPVTNNGKNLKDCKALLEQFKGKIEVPLANLDAMILMGAADIAVWAAQSRDNIQAFSDRFHGGAALEFPALELWGGVMNRYPIMRDIFEQKFKAV